MGEDFATEIVVELNTGDASGLAIGHAGNRTRDRRRGAAGGAKRAALESHAPISPYRVLLGKAFRLGERLNPRFCCNPLRAACAIALSFL